MKVAEIRSRFLDFFSRHGHQVVESASLVPHNDPTLLFTNSGMVQFKDCFLGKELRPYVRATTSQKCVRAGGKHNDLENVGFTARHHTFFEMLGNFSFGDYFKRDAIRFAWKFVTEELKLPIEKLHVTVYEKDDEAEKIWLEESTLPKERIYRFGEKDNFWSMGETGPCGPCSELYIDRGEKYGGPECGKTKVCKMGCDCDRYMEFWNLVFMQYERDSEGTLTPLPKPAVDTGAGLERLASILQQVDSNYETDVFINIIEKTAALISDTYTSHGPKTSAYRVVADHARAMTFLIADGVMPSNEGRGYVLRRIMRRAIRYGKNLGFKGEFLARVCGFVVDEMVGAYPYLKDQANFISRVVKAEEEQFLKTLDKGLALLDEELGKLSHHKLPGAVAFKLYDTFGFPLDLTKVICAEKKISLDDAEFDQAMAKQKAQSRKNWKGSGESSVDSVYFEVLKKISESKKQSSEFVGYDVYQGTSQCLALLLQEDEKLKVVNSVSARDAQDAEKCIVEAVFDQNYFYAEGGGQVADSGKVTTEKGLYAEVLDVQKPIDGLVVVTLSLHKGSLTVGEKTEQHVDAIKRSSVMRNHTATHLLHGVLREVLGTHVKQAGSLVTPDFLRFDFSHFESLTSEQLNHIESKVNAYIWNGSQVEKKWMSKEEAQTTGAIAFFGDKYGDQVRVVKVGTHSTEFCGGCHVNTSSDIHLFKITSESSIASGVRRMQAVTSEAAYRYLDRKAALLARTKEMLKAQSDTEIPEKAEKISIELKTLQKEIERRELEKIRENVLRDLSVAQHLGPKSTPVVAVKSLSMSSTEAKSALEYLRSLDRDVVGMYLYRDAKNPEVIQISVGVSKSLEVKVPSGELLKNTLPQFKGRGGGKPDFAQGGGVPVGDADALLKSVVKEVEARLQ